MLRRFVIPGVAVVAAGVVWFWATNEGIAPIIAGVAPTTAVPEIPDPRYIDVPKKQVPTPTPLPPPTPVVIDQTPSPATTTPSVDSSTGAIEETLTPTAVPAPPAEPTRNQASTMGMQPRPSLPIPGALTSRPMATAPAAPIPSAPSTSAAETGTPAPTTSSPTATDDVVELTKSAAADAQTTSDPPPATDRALTQSQRSPPSNTSPQPAPATANVLMTPNALADPEAQIEAPSLSARHDTGINPIKPATPATLPQLTPLPAVRLEQLQPLALPPSASDAAKALPPALSFATADDHGPPPGTTLAEEAQAFVDEIAATLSRPIETTAADHFVRPQQRLMLSAATPTDLDSRHTGTAEELLRATGLDLHAPITVVRVTERLEPLDPSRLLARFDGDLGTPIEVKQGQSIARMTLGKALEHHRLKPSSQLQVVRKLPQYDTTTLEKLRAEASSAPGTQFEILPHAVTFDEKTVEELLGLHKRASEDSVFYVRTVSANDVQGIWGIIHSALIDNFAKGMAVQRGMDINTYRVTIPRDADERHTDSSSSFLGRLIHRKAAATTVYNFKQGRMSTNADLILPGQQLVIVDFSPDELIAIYQHFVYRANSRADITSSPTTR